MQLAKKEYRKFNKKKYSSFILAGDIGGTNTNLGIFGIKKNRLNLLISFHFKSQEIKGLYEAVNEVLHNTERNHLIKITKACFAVAGVLSPNKDFAEVTNSAWNVSKKELLKKTTLKKIILLNDFEAIGYGINLIDKKELITIKKAKKTPKAPIVVIGAGTGLGKTTLEYSEHFKSYIPLHSEAGHSDFPAQNKHEFELINFIKKYKKRKASVSYEQVLSGQGLENIYLFLRNSRKFKETLYTKEIGKSKNKPELISKHRKVDATCKATFDMFKVIFAKFARNFALDSVAWGGVYIAGGIAPKNKEIFDRKFVKIFEDNYKLADVLKKTPIYLILNCNAGLLGAGFFGAKHFCLT